jgi:hypothetical protein
VSVCRGLALVVLEICAPVNQPASEEMKASTGKEGSGGPVEVELPLKGFLPRRGGAGGGGGPAAASRQSNRGMEVGNKYDAGGHHHDHAMEEERVPAAAAADKGKLSVSTNPTRLSLSGRQIEQSSRRLYHGKAGLDLDSNNGVPAAQTSSVVMMDAEEGRRRSRKKAWLHSTHGKNPLMLFCMHSCKSLHQRMSESQRIWQP